MIPQTFNEWKHCIINECKISLTADFARQRLAVYQNRQHGETQRFIGRYGEAHLQRVIDWCALFLDSGE